MPLRSYMTSLLLFNAVPVFSAVFNQFDELLYSFLFGDVPLNTFFLFIKTYLATGCPYVAVVGIGHFSRSVDNAAQP